MNALEMKLESTELDLGTQAKCMDGNGKKCKGSRKKLNPIGFDKGLQASNGLGRESNSSVFSDSKCILTAEAICTKKKRAKKNYENNKMLAKSEKIQERLQNSLSEDTKKKITSILNDIKMLSDVEKLLLYLQLPTGSSASDDPLKQKGQNNPLGKKADEEGTLAVTWIQSHLEEDPDVSLPKQEVYDEYQSYCEITGNEPLCAADFGKVMKQIFPSVKPRRLGTRGNSRYCYSGLRKKLKVGSPFLPDVQVEKTNCKSVTDEADEVLTAACHVLFEWAEKLLGIEFTSLKELASYLIENMFVDNRSVAAFTLLLSTSPQQLERVSSLGTAKVETKNKKSEAQMHLQRKIQEKELIKEQKLKLQEHRSYLVTSYDNKRLQARRKGFRSRKVNLHNGSKDQVSKKATDSSGSGTDCKSTTEAELSTKHSEKKNCSEHNSVIGSSSNDSDKCQQSQLTFQPSDSSSLFSKKSHHQNSTNLLIVEDTVKKKQKSKLSLTSNKSPVCIPQSLPSFIIVPSLQQVQLSDTGNRSNNKTLPKYKRIQPKPLSELTAPSVMRCRTGSLGSAVLKEGKPRSDGRRSSLALMQSDSSEECTENYNSNLVQKSSGLKPLSSNGKIIKPSLSIKSEIPIASETPSDKNSDLNSLRKGQYFDSLCLNSHHQDASKHPNILKAIGHDQSLKLGPPKTESLNDDVTGTKRPSEEHEFETVTKRPHLDELGSSDVSSESLSPWAKDVPNISSSSSFVQSNHSDEIDVTRKQEGVSIHELESDALIDYLRGVGTSDNAVTDSLCKVSHSNAFVFNALQSKNLLSNESLSAEVNKNFVNPEVSQLSQLRILLEQNLPHTMTKSPRMANETNTLTKKPSVLMHTNDLTAAQIESLGNNKNSLLNNNELSAVFLRNVNPYLNNEEISSSNILPGNQINAESLLSSDLSSAGLITEQDLLTVMAEPAASFPKNHSILVNASVSKNSVNETDLIPCNLPTSSDMQQLYTVVGIEHSSAQTQVPSVPPSPNTRRRAFNFMPISPRHTPVPEGINGSNTAPCFSPVPIQQPQNTVSVAVGPSQPPSNAGSPFVSPRSTPVPPSRSRHSSGQSTYSTSRHTPFQNFDSGVSSISSSPFISPQPTPVPVSRLRHNSSHGPCKTVTFSTVNNNQVVHTLSSVIGHGPLRLRHSSGSASSYLGFSLLSPRSAPLSPLVNENASTHFNFPTVSETRSRHSSGLTTTPLSPVSEQVSPSIASSHPIDVSIPFANNLLPTDPFINHNSGKEMIGVNPIFKQTRQRHASSSVIYSKPSVAVDPLAQEVQLFLKNGSENLMPSGDVCNRSRSVPLHQMLQNLASSTVSFQSHEDLKSYATTTTTKQSNAFPMLVSSSAVSSLPVTSDSLIMHCDKSLQPMQNDWATLDGSSDMEMSSARRNLTGLLEGDDLQTTLEDLRDCDTDFSKFAQELELSQNEDGAL